jgi:ribonuclease-3
MTNNQAKPFVRYTPFIDNTNTLFDFTDSTESFDSSEYETDSEGNLDKECIKQGTIGVSYENDVILGKNQIIKKQIEDDLATHDFSVAHVTREDLQKILGMKVKNISYYQRALVHKSIHKAVKRYVPTPEKPLQEYLTQHNERLEFLGDSVLGLIIAHYLFNRFPDCDEGFLTKMKTKLVNSSQLAHLANKIELGKYILMSNHVQNIKGRHSQKILEDTFEAFLAAIFKDLGFEAANQFVINLINTLDFDDLLKEDNYKDLLLKYTQVHFKKCTLSYDLVQVEGPPHNRTFTVVVTINGVKYCEGTAKSKKSAEKIAAENTLIKLK